MYKQLTTSINICESASYLLQKKPKSTFGGFSISFRLPNPSHVYFSTLQK